jgi:hypothetical protein
VKDELDKSRDRQYPKRCQGCFNFEALCTCTKDYRVPVPKSGVRVRDPRRIRAAVYN